MTATAEIPPTRAEINRRNAQRSTGPKSQAGKERSRFNALKHGCRATLPILPGEDPEAYQERLDAWIDKFQPRDAVETYMVERAVQASWQLDRADRAEAATMVEAADELALGRAREILALGETLFRAPARGREPDGVRVSDGDDRPLSWPFDPEHPRHPEHVVVELEGMAQGCTWLLQRWAALGEALDGGRIWRAVDRLRAIRLLGKQPLDAVADETVLSIYLACQAMDPHGPDLLAEPLIDLLHPEAMAAHQRQTERFATARAERSPPDAVAGRAALRAIVSAAVARLEALWEDRAKAEAEAPSLSEASARMPHRVKETLEWLWKHQARCSRSLCRMFDELRKVRRDFGDDLLDSPGPMSVVRGPSPGSKSVEGADLLATGAEPAAVEPAGDLDARDVTDEDGSCRLTGGNAPGAGLMTPTEVNALGAGLMTNAVNILASRDTNALGGYQSRISGGRPLLRRCSPQRSHDPARRQRAGRGSHDPTRIPNRRSPTVLQPPDSRLKPRSHRPARALFRARDNGKRTTYQSNEAIAPIDLLPVTRDDGPRPKSGTTDGGPKGHRPGPAGAALLHGCHRGPRGPGAGSCDGTAGVPESPFSAQGSRRIQRDERSQSGHRAEAKSMERCQNHDCMQRGLRSTMGKNG
jgi:hypothetical protein